MEQNRTSNSSLLRYKIALSFTVPSLAPTFNASPNKSPLAACPPAGKANLRSNDSSKSGRSSCSKAKHTRAPVLLQQCLHVNVLHRSTALIGDFIPFCTISTLTKK